MASGFKSIPRLAWVDDTGTLAGMMVSGSGIGDRGGTLPRPLIPDPHAELIPSTVLVHSSELRD
jgi:hypothetical protein